MPAKKKQSKKVAAKNNDSWSYLKFVLPAILVLVAGIFGVKQFLDANAATDPDAYVCSQKAQGVNYKDDYKLVKTGKLMNGKTQAPAVYKIYLGKKYWCGITVASPSTYGDSRKPMSVKLETNLIPRNGRDSRTDSNKGEFKYYAGAVHTKRSFLQGDGATITSTMKYNNKTYSATEGYMILNLR